MPRTMAQPSSRRPAIDVGPEHARVLEILRLAPKDAKARLAVRRERPWMIQRVGIELHAGGASGQGTLDGAIEQPGPDALADIARGETEEGYLVVLQLEVADEVAVMTRDVDLVSLLGEHVRQCCI